MIFLVKIISIFLLITFAIIGNMLDERYGKILEKIYRPRFQNEIINKILISIFRIISFILAIIIFLDLMGISIAFPKRFM
jgi:hypothetical protein